MTKFRYIQIPISPEEDAALDTIKRGAINSANKKETSSLGMLKHLPTMLWTLNNITAKAVHYPAVREIRKEQFDLVVFGWFLNDFQLGLAGHFRCPSVLVTATPAFKTLRSYVGNPSEFTYQQSPMAGKLQHMTFLQRFQNWCMILLENFVELLLHYFVAVPYYEAHFPASENYPPYSEVLKNVSLVLATQHFSQTGPQLSFPAMIEVSGMHLKTKPDPLPKVYEDKKRFIL